MPPIFTDRQAGLHGFSAIDRRRVALSGKLIRSARRRPVKTSVRLSGLEMHDTPPPPPVRIRDTSVLLDDLCVALREVGVRDYELPKGQRVVQSVQDVRAIDAELKERGVDTSARLRELSSQTHWQMEALLADCRDYPRSIPFVKEGDGIRRRLRCTLCRIAERPQNAEQFWMCDACIRRVIDAIHRREPVDNIILFRTYNAAARCEHADEESVLAAEAWNDTIFGNCEECFGTELARRAGEHAEHSSRNKRS